MRITCWNRMALVIVVAVTSGCRPAAITPSSAEADAQGDHQHEQHAASSPAAGHDHAGWWCQEHGVPEAVCALCDSKVAAEFQKKGDWCQQHDRPDSQCFVCHPELASQFAAQYEAKYGKKPPRPHD